MASDATKEEFWACTLTKETPDYVFDPKNESEEDVEHKLQINTACLGDKAKPGERNLVCVTTEDDAGKKITCNLLSLKLGLSECCYLDVGFRNATTFSLKSGTGPVSLSGVHLQALPLDFESDGDEEESEDEEVGLQKETAKKETIVKAESKPVTVKEEAKPAIADARQGVKEPKALDIKPAVHVKNQAAQDVKPAETKGKRGQPGKSDAGQNEPPQKKKKDAEEESEEEEEDDEEEDDDDEDGEDDGESDDEEMPSLLDGEDEDASEDEDSDAEDEDDGDEEDEEDTGSEEEEEVSKPPPKGKSVKTPQGKAGGKAKEQTPAKPAMNKADAGKPPGKSGAPAQTPKAAQQKPKNAKTPGSGGAEKTIDEIKAILLKSPNLPKKVDKFRNYMSNTFKMTNATTQDELWAYVQNNKK